MIANTLPHTRRHLRDPIGVNDVAEIIGTAAEQLFDLAEHFESMNREPESHALSRVALQLMSEALFFRSTRKLGTTKNFDVVVMSLRSAGTIDGETYQDLTKVLAGDNLKGKSMRRLVDTLRRSQKRTILQRVTRTAHEELTAVAIS